MSKYQENERDTVPSKKCFNGDKFNGVYKGKPREFVLEKSENNFFDKELCNKVIAYFKKNNISWWGGKKPTGHILSSQIACLNHLFPIRNDKNAVLAIAKMICEDFTEVLELKNDTDDTRAFISFEVVSDNDYLNECKEGKNPTRGANCTSIDALILAKHKNGTVFLLPIEWKYTEFYNNTDKSTEDGKDHEKGSMGSGKERLCRYSNLITESEQLKTLPEYKSSVYFFEPFYQLMRQTLWAEQMIAHKATETIKADDFIHVHVIPKENHDLLKDDLETNKWRKGYKNGTETGSLESIWKSCLKDKKKYKIISPEDLLSNLEKEKQEKLIAYLLERYNFDEQEKIINDNRHAEILKDLQEIQKLWDTVIDPNVNEWKVEEQTDVIWLRVFQNFAKMQISFDKQGGPEANGYLFEQLLEIRKEILTIFNLPDMEEEILTIYNLPNNYEVPKINKSINPIRHIQHFEMLYLNEVPEMEDVKDIVESLEVYSYEYRKGS
ncbi:MAG: hypothetical protein LBR66_01855 [Candidatus Symbiothrix sp.]|jgi:hypothetical protein|nr:hypothetical protein [Candidatus Symbiothrix sp.]